jgi:hypothetical protein
MALRGPGPCSWRSCKGRGLACLPAFLYSERAGAAGVGLARGMSLRVRVLPAGGGILLKLCTTVGLGEVMVPHA